MMAIVHSHSVQGLGLGRRNSLERVDHESDAVRKTFGRHTHKSTTWLWELLLSFMMIAIKSIEGQWTNWATTAEFCFLR